MQVPVTIKITIRTILKAKILKGRETVYKMTICGYRRNKSMKTKKQVKSKTTDDH